MPLVALLEEGIAALLEERLMRVHPGAVLAEDRLGHEGGVVPGLLRDLLHDEAVRDRVVCHRERIRVAHVDLVLRGADLVVVILDGDAHRLEGVNRPVAEVGRRVQGRHREVAALVERLGSLVRLEEEVLELWPDVERVEAHAPHALDRPPQHVAGIAFVGLPVGSDDVADHPRDAMLALVGRHQLERVRIRDRDHVRLLDRVEPCDRRAVEPHPVVERAFDLARRDREALQVPLDVAEPEQEELHALVLDPLQHLLPLRRIARRPVLRLHHRHPNRLLKQKAPGAGREPEATSPHKTARLYQARAPHMMIARREALAVSCAAYRHGCPSCGALLGRRARVAAEAEPPEPAREREQHDREAEREGERRPAEP